MMHLSGYLVYSQSEKDGTFENCELPEVLGEDSRLWGL
jgi:hypothetical protein